MFDHTHYVPILRWREAERKALMHLHASVRDRITPLIEIHHKGLPSSTSADSGIVHKTLDDIATEIRDCWCYNPVFVDMNLFMQRVIATAKNHPLEILAQKSRRQFYRLKIIPVTGLHRDKRYQGAVKKLCHSDRRGICLRLLRQDIADTKLQEQLDALLHRFNLTPEEVDLIVDYQIVDNPSLPNLAHICKCVPYLDRWRTFSFASGTLPMYLSDLEKNRQHEIRRTDWIEWRDQVMFQELERKPTFSDYTIQHPIYSDTPIPPFFSASIRYTAEEYWVIMRGENVFQDGGPGFKQYPANALLLAERPEFKGGNFSDGDQYIETMGAQTQRTGNAKTWLQAGFNHHISLVTYQLSGLFGPSTAHEP